MIIATATIKLYAPWVHSLKEKRMIVKSLLNKIQCKFNLAVAEVAAQDVYQTIVIAVAGIAANSAQADSILEKVICFIDNNTEAEILTIEQEMR
ncbi:MAG: DUF503 domain-containing protein [Bacillota bacterium]|jgi:uncharacterized protein YlxP (DUF503 family)